MTTQQNEAACLLEKGALYTRREGLLWEGRDLVFAGFKQGVFSLYYGDAPIYHFDLEGRWQRAYLRDRHFIRRLDGPIQEVDRVRDGANLVMRRRTLEPAEARRLDEEIRGVAETLLADLAGGRRLDPPDDKARPIEDAELREFLGRVASWDAAAWEDFEARYRRAYRPQAFIPPDCPNALVLQATVGDRDGRGFAGGAARDHEARNPEEFAAHAREIAALIGGRLAQTRTAFLAGSDVLRLPGGDVTAYLESIERELRDEDGPAIDDVHAFLDEFQDPVLNLEGLREARRGRLARIALGVESGAPEVRRAYGKDWCDADLHAFAAAAKDAGIGLSVLTLVGAGGRERRSEHVEGTRRLIESLLLSRGDLVFLMDERELADPAGAAVGFEPLDEAEWTQQLAELRRGLAGLRERGVKVVPYSMVKQSG